MSYIGYDELGITAAVIAAALACLVLVWNAVKAIRDWRELARKPTADKIADHERRIVKLEECCEEAHAKLQGDWEFRQNELEFNKLMLKSVKHLLSHEIDGNNTDGLRLMEKEIDNYLVNQASRGV